MRGEIVDCILLTWFPIQSRSSPLILSFNLSLRNFLVENRSSIGRNTAPTGKIFERMMASDFWEVGASGARYSRQFVLDELERRHASPHEDVWETSGFQCRRLASDVYLLTYTLLQHKTRLTRRSTIWERTADGWKIVCHQGTTAQRK